VAIASYLSNFRANTKPRATKPKGPFVTNVRQQPTTKGGPVVTGRVQQPTTRPPKAALPALAPPAAASVPPAAGPPGPVPLPPDATYEQQIAAAVRNRDATLAGLGQQRTQGLQEYGYTENQQGGVAFDPTNPFSRASLLRKSYQESQAGNQTSMAARGQLYSGALQNQQDFTQAGFNQSDNALQRGLLAFLASNTGAKTRAGVDYETAAGAAEADRVGRAAQSPLYDALALSQTPAPAAAAPGGPAPYNAKTNPLSGVGLGVLHTAPSPQHGGQMWVYYRGASGKLIPLRPA
jgi:hypothetical protein